MMLTLLLARYGLGDTLMCYDLKPGTLKAGQADGLQPRTLEVLKSLDLADEIINHGCHMSEVAFWNPKSSSSSNSERGIERTSFTPDVVVPARYKHEVTIHQGRIERILEDNMKQYSTGCVQRSTKFINFQIDPVGDPEYPIVLDLELESSSRERVSKRVRTKYLVGADGAHSQVRRTMGLQLQGETTDHIWGVMDFVAETNFPDIRKRCAIHSDVGSVMVIPRERINTGQYLTRLYVQVKDEVPAQESGDPNDPLLRKKSSNRRAAITLDYIINQAQRVFYPYKIAVKKNTVIDWWAAYQIGQRMTSKFSMCDGFGLERVFIVGDGNLATLPYKMTHLLILVRSLSYT
jgi:phenol 2-monooxygenase